MSLKETEPFSVLLCLAWVSKELSVHQSQLMPQAPGILSHKFKEEIQMNHREWISEKRVFIIEA